MSETATALPTKTGSSEITRLNALRHGVLSKHTVLPWEEHANTTRWSTRSPKSTRREVPPRSISWRNWPEFYGEKALVVTVLGVPDAAFFQAVPRSTLCRSPVPPPRAACSAPESGLLGPSPTPTALRSVLGGREGGEDLVTSLLDLGQLGISGPAAAAWLRTIAHATARTRNPTLCGPGPRSQAYTLGIPDVCTKSCSAVPSARSGRAHTCSSTVPKRSRF
jgi:hypothetical protein